MKSQAPRIHSSFLIVGAALGLLAAAACTSQDGAEAPGAGKKKTVSANSMPDREVETERIDERYPKALSVGDTGVRYIVTMEGDGKLAETGSNVTVNYRGTLWDGTVFDSSYERKEPIQFTLGSGRVIRGWDLGIAGMRVGEARILIIPYSLAYGARGRPPSVPQRAPLIFDVELVAVN